MERIFTPKTDHQLELVNIIKTNPDKRKRKSALGELRTILGLNPNDPLCGLRSKEHYESINGKPSYFRRFRMATVVYDDIKLYGKITRTN